MTAVTHEPVGRVGRAPWLRVGWGVFLGYVLTAVVLLPAFGALHLTGILWRPWRNQAPVVGIDWPYGRHGVWSTLADLGAIAAVLAVAAICIAWCVRRQTGRPAPAAAIFVCLLVTGYVPFAAYDGLFALRSAAAFLLTVVLVRWRAADAGWGGDPRRRATLTGLVGAGAAIAIAFGVVHPLRPEGSLAPLPDDAYSIVIRNAGHRGLTLRSVEPYPAPAGLVELRPQLERAPPAGSGPIAGARIPARSEWSLYLEPRLAGCGDGTSGYATIDRLIVRYHLFGRTQTQALPLGSPLRVTCP